MYYLMNVSEGILIHDGKKRLVVKTSMRQFVDRLLIERHTTLEGRTEALRKKYGFKNNVPILIDGTCCLYKSESMRNLSCVLINVHSVLSLKRRSDGMSIIVFKDLSTLNVRIRYERLSRRHTQAKRLAHVSRLDFPSF